MLIGLWRDPYNALSNKSPCNIGLQIAKKLPHDRPHPGSFLKPDLWHWIDLGIGKWFVASSLPIALERDPASNNDERFGWLTDHYLRWCRSVKRSSFVSKISGYVVSYGDGPGATGNWPKGVLTSYLCPWLIPLLTDLGTDDEGLLPRCKEGAWTEWPLRIKHEANMILSKFQKPSSTKNMYFL